MGFLDKVKNLFTEEYEVEEQKPIKKEMVQVEIPAPVEDVKFELPKRREVEVPNEQIELPKEEYKREIPREIKREEIRKPVFFDDKDFLDLEKTKEIRKQPKVEVKKETYGIKKVEEKKKFSPTPIISPVYGILDKNYHKEDITTKSSATSRLSYKSTKKITIDEVRNKAFGTLEDDLETTLVNAPIFEEQDYDVKKIETISDELFADLTEDPKPKHSLDNDVEVTEDDEINKNMTLEELENLERAKTRTRRSKKVIVEATEDTISNSELFDLIDSMYDRRDE